MKTNDERLAQVQCMALTLFNRGWIGIMVINDVHDFVNDLILDDEYPDIVDAETAMDFMNAVIMELDRLEDEFLQNEIDNRED